MLEFMLGKNWDKVAIVAIVCYAVVELVGMLL